MLAVAGNAVLPGWAQVVVVVSGTNRDSTPDVANQAADHESFFNVQTCGLKQAATAPHTSGTCHEGTSSLLGFA